MQNNLWQNASQRLPQIALNYQTVIFTDTKELDNMFAQKKTSTRVLDKSSIRQGILMQNQLPNTDDVKSVFVLKKRYKKHLLEIFQKDPDQVSYGNLN